MSQGEAKVLEQAMNDLKIKCKELSCESQEFVEQNKEEVKAEQPIISQEEEEEKKEKKQDKGLEQQGQIIVPKTTSIKNTLDIKTLFSTKTWESFKKFTIPKEMLIALAEAKFPRPSKIQGSTIPLIRNQNSEHLIAQAKNGAGKTAAFVIGSLLRIDVANPNTQIICVAHTRQLVSQIGDVYSKISKGMGVQICANPTRKDKGQIMVSTPQKAIEFVERNKKSLDMKCFIVDQADHLFEEKTSSDFLERILKALLDQYPKIQCSFFSATMPQSIRDIIVKYIKQANQVSLQKTSEQLTIKQLQQYYMICGEKQKPSLLEEIYSSMAITSTIVFVNTRDYAVKLTNFLRKHNHSVSLIMGGDMHRDERDQIMQKFRDGKTKVLISTDLLARGIDVMQVSLVVNYDIPMQINRANISEKLPNFEGYLHRIGRTARYGREGIAITFIQNKWQQKLIEDIGKHYNVEIKQLKRQDVTNLVSKAMADNKEVEEEIIDFK